MSLLNLQDRTAVAYALHDAGFQPQFSTNVGEYLTAGYGDCQGEFEYPLYLVEDKIQKWEDVKEWLKTEEKMDNAINVITGNLDEVVDGGYILFEGEVYKAGVRTWRHAITGRPVKTFEFYSPDGKQQLQSDSGYFNMPLSDWFLHFASGSVNVCDVEESE